MQPTAAPAPILSSSGAGASVSRPGPGKGSGPAPSKPAAVGWIVKRWRVESLERLLEDDALAALAGVRAQADRDARQAQRAAARTAAEAAAQLHALERLGQGLRVMVAEHRSAVRAAAPREAPLAVAEPVVRDLRPRRTVEPAPEPSAEPAAEPTGDPVATVAEPARPQRRRTGRASLRSSALTELFRVTEQRRVGAPPAA